MSSVGISSEQAHALIASGLRLAEQSDLASALNHWELATEFDPELRAAALLVELTEAYLEARGTGGELELPDFRAHLGDIGYLLPDELRRGRDVSSGLGLGDRASESSDASQPPVPTISGTQRERTWQGPGTARTSRPGQTVYGLPHRSADDTSSSGGRGLTKPRYQAVAPPPPTHRRGSATPAPSRGRPQPATSDGEASAARPPGSVDPRAPTAVTRTTDREAGFDPWADLGSELAQVPSGEWDLAGQGRQAPVSGAEPHGGTATPAGARASQPSSAWDDTEHAPPPKRPATPRGLGVGGVTGDFELEDDLPESLRDPFAVLDDHGIRDAPPASALLTEPPPREAGRTGSVRTSAARPVVPGGREEGSSPDLFELFDDENLLLGDPFEGEPLLGPEGRSQGPLEGRASDPHEAVEIIVDDDLDDEGFDFELIDAESGEVITNPVYTPPASSAFEPPYDVDRDLDGVQADDELWERAKHHHSLGDYSTSEKLAGALLESNPGHRHARELLQANRLQREKRHLARLRSYEATPRIVLGQEQLVWQNLDAKKGFILSRVDGLLTVQDIIDIANLPRHETIRILADLVDEGILAMM